jgi:hypothetical protein
MKRDSLKPWLLLSFILLFSLLNQWGRWLPVYLSLPLKQKCAKSCQYVNYSPLCDDCGSEDEGCIVCHECRLDNNSLFYNFQDGVCMNTQQYGLITGPAFSLTFSLFGLLAGIYVDITSERSATILGTLYPSISLSPHLTP